MSMLVFIKKNKKINNNLINIIYYKFKLINFYKKK